LPETQGKSLEELEQQFKMEDWPRLRKAGNLDDEESLEENEIKRKKYEENEGQQRQSILP